MLVDILALALDCPTWDCRNKNCLFRLLTSIVSMSIYKQINVKANINNFQNKIPVTEASKLIAQQPKKQNISSNPHNHLDLKTHSE